MDRGLILPVFNRDLSWLKMFESTKFGANWILIPELSGEPARQTGRLHLAII